MESYETHGINSTSQGVFATPNRGNPNSSINEAKLTERICKLFWKNFLPHQLEGIPITVEYINHQSAYEFIRGNLSRIAHSADPTESFLSEDRNQTKEQYLDEVVDAFSFRNEKGEIIGVFLGNLLDWSTYYLRYMGLLEEYQGIGIYQTFIRYLSQVLVASGFERLEGHVAPSNFLSVRAHTSLGFNITGFALSERWGALVVFTKFLSKASEAVFLKQFCHGNKPQLKY